MKIIIILLLYLQISKIFLKTLENKIDDCILYLINENNKKYEKLKTDFENINKSLNNDPEKRISQKFNIYRTLNALRQPKPLPQTYISDETFLQDLLNKKGIIKIEDISPFPNTSNNIFKNILLWKGDITRLKVDAIVNAANNELLGCWSPLHNCIDNIINSYAGVQLRNEMKKIMDKKGELEEAGKAELSNGYNLFAKYIIHTVGPIVYGELTKKHKNTLKNCYKSILNLAVKNNIKSVAFCCISTGVFNFPNEEAAKIAVETVVDFMKENKDIKVIFDVYLEKDEIIYKKILEEKINKINENFNDGCNSEL